MFILNMSEKKTILQFEIIKKDIESEKQEKESKKMKNEDVVRASAGDEQKRL